MCGTGECVHWCCSTQLVLLCVSCSGGVVVCACYDWRHVVSDVWLSLLPRWYHWA